MKHTATITLTKKEYKEIKDALDNKTRPEYGQLTHTAVFDDGMVMDVKCVASQDEDEGAWTEAVLFKPDEYGALSEVAGTPASDDYLGEWECTYKGDTYTVNVIVALVKPIEFASVHEDGFSDVCPSCDTSFSSQFGQCVCSHCGFISAGCDACPGESNDHIDCSKCPVSMPIRLYGIFNKKEFNSLPNEYKGTVYHKANQWFMVLVNNRVYHIYSERKVIGVTTIDMDEWRKGNHSLSKTPTIQDILD